MKFNVLPDDISKISTKFSALKKYHGEEVVGWDIETTKKGNLYILSNNKKAFFKPTFEECLTHLLHYGRGKINFHYNIRFDFDSIIKPYFQNMSIPKDKVEYKGFIIEWIDKKYYKISKNKMCAFFFDVANFFTGSLNNNAKKFLDDKKVEIDIVNAIYEAEAKGDKKLIEDIMYYCKYDADLTKRLGELLIKTTIELLGFAPKYWFSKAFLSEVYLRNYIPTKTLKPFDRIPKHMVRQILSYSFSSYKGGLFNIWYKGMCSGTQIDINSAYPDKIATLVDISNGHWESVLRYNKDCTYGFYRVKHQFDGYMPYRLKEGLIIYPVLTQHLYMDFITKTELDYIISKGLKYELLDGYEFYANKISYPFKEVIEKLYAKKREFKEKSMESEYMLVKIIMNSIYGKFAQTKGGIGNLFNPVYASIITANTRLQICEKLIPLFDEVYEVATDSVFGKIDKRKLAPTKELGGYEIVFDGKCIILLCGIKCDENGFMLKTRGFTKVKVSIEEVLSDNKLRIKMMRPIHLKESMIQHDIDRVNTFEEFIKEQNIRDEKMLWFLPKNITFKDLKTHTFKGIPISDWDLQELNAEY